MQVDSLERKHCVLVRAHKGSSCPLEGEKTAGGPLSEPVSCLNCWALGGHFWKK